MKALVYNGPKDVSVTEVEIRASSSPPTLLVIAGDALVTLDPYTAERAPKIVAGAATADSFRNLETLDALAETEAETRLTGHGPAWREGAAQAVARARAAGPS